MEVTLRPAREADLVALERINSDVQRFPWSHNALEDELKNSRSKSWVLLIGESVVAYLLGRINEGEFEILTLGTDAAHQKKGYAEKLLRHAVKEVQGAKVFLLEVSHLNEGAITLYKKVGFEVYHIRRKYYPDDSDALCMKLDIANP